MILEPAIPNPSSTPAVNKSFDWDRFNSQSYHDHNYHDLRSDDHDILEIVRDHFVATAPRTPTAGIDVGAGPNLYPSLSMLPFCDRIDLYDYSKSNVDWLSRQIPHYDSSWDRFWEVLKDRPAYADIDRPRRRFADRARVTHGNVFKLPRRAWGIGTMFFVAESLTEDVNEFQLAMASFAAALRVGAPFAAAFMADSRGYLVDDVWFPAVAINRFHVAESLAGITSDVHIFDVTSEHPLREGYAGMIVATGRIAAASE